jgi:hypothetical protein
MRTKKHIEVLLENGIHFNTISKMNKNQIKILAEKFETKEAVQTVPRAGYETKITPGSKANININGTDLAVDPAKGITIMSPTKPVGTGETTESKELDERFASKAQQKLFFVKCGAGKTKEEKKWCKMRDEFAASTKKMDYKKMPEKLYPEKTVKYKKKRTDENYEQYLENRIFEMIEKHIEPSMTKGELLKTIQERVNNSEKFVLKSPKKNTMFSENEGMEMKTMKKPIGKVSSFEMKENTKEKEAPTKPGTKSPGKRKNPFKDPNPGVEEKPKASTKEKQAPTKPGTKTPTRRKGNPFKDPNPGVKENPKAEDQKNDFMSVLNSILNK